MKEKKQLLINHHIFNIIQNVLGQRQITNNKRFEVVLTIRQHDIAVVFLNGQITPNEWLKMDRKIWAYLRVDVNLIPKTSYNDLLQKSWIRRNFRSTTKTIQIP
jgi:hypothetical protein